MQQKMQSAKKKKKLLLVASRMEKIAVATSFSLSSHLTRTVVGLAMASFLLFSI